MLIRPAALFLIFCVSLSAQAQPAPCPEDPEIDYEGPCYHGALPAFFDDFEYASARTTGDVADATESDLFSANEWTLRKGTERTRAWYRFNRGDLPIAGSITFDRPSIMRMELSEGLASTEYIRTPVVASDFTAEGGTYAWRIQLSALWEGQRVRHAAWTHSNASYVFDQTTPTDTIRYRFWSELDFENENQFQGERRNGVFVPDYVARMSVGNHYGHLKRPGHNRRRMGADGLVPDEVGRGTLARNGPGRGAAVEAPLLPSWDDVWLYLVIEVDEEERSVTYRMIPEEPHGALRALEGESVTVDSVFYPLYPTHPALSVHWIEPQGMLRHPLYLEADWFYYSPLADLSVESIRRQIHHLRQRAIPRLNTTGRTTFRGYHDTQPIQPFVRGPRQVACGEEATWTLGVQRLGRYYMAHRYRFLRADGSREPWMSVYEPTVTLSPQRGQSGVEIEVTAQDFWAPHGVVKGAAGWAHPHPENDKEQTRFIADFNCETP